jgi:lipopolysaccharide transport system ATP-binding protein
MRKTEIARKFDEIVAFAEVEKFIDTPVKRYSSGMYLRLAFAVAAHLEPEILIVDEVLAVGDASFQTKCLGKMEDVRRQGRTVLFVSHNMNAITRLCQRTILLEAGGIIADAPSHQVVRKYLESGIGLSATREWPDPEKAPGGSIVRLRAVRVRSENAGTAEAMDIRRPIALDMHYDVLEPGHILSGFYELYNEEGVQVFSAVDLDPSWQRRPRPVGCYQSTAWIPGNLLSEGTFLVGAGVTAMKPQLTELLYESNAVAFQVCDPLEGNSARGDWTDEWGGVVRPLLKWETQYSPEPIAKFEIGLNPAISNQLCNSQSEIKI